MRPEPDAVRLETAALVALLRTGRRSPARLADLVEETGSAQRVLESEAGLLAHELADAALTDVKRWSGQGLQLVTVLDAGYPQNLRAVHDRPPLIFVVGKLKPDDSRAVAVIGSRRASPAGIRATHLVTEALIASGHTIVSGLAAGIDTAAHNTALDHGARTIAVIGTGLSRCYPPENASLQRRIGDQGAVVSQFWPQVKPSRKTFPLRNAVMSGLTLATVIVEAGPTSGARTQARLALGHGRPVLLAGSLLDQPWARTLAERPGTAVFESAGELAAIVKRISSVEVPVS